MNLLATLAAGAALLAAPPAFAGNALSDTHPEEAYPDKVPPLFQPGPHADFVRQVQEKLHALDFDAGPVNGELGAKTQAALAQFQLSRNLPASGTLDDETLSELGVQRDELASAGAGATSD